MTITETRPEDASAPAPVAALLERQEPAQQDGLVGWMTTVDHKRIGRIFVVIPLLYLVGALVIGVLLGLERVDPEGAAILPLDKVAQLVSIYQLGLAFLVVIPLLLGIGIAIVPLQIGARGIAFPRAAALAAWSWVGGSALLIVAYCINGGPGGGRTNGVNLFLSAFVVVILSLCLAAVCLATTVMTMRTKGMAMSDVPMFAWASLVTSSLLLVTLPVLLADLVFLFVDNKHASVQFGGNAAMSAYIDWIVRQPQTYLFALPALGIVAEIIAVMAGQRPAHRQTTMAAIGLGGILGVGIVFQTALTPNVTTQPLFNAMAILAVLPPLIVLATSGVTLRAGKPKLASPLVWAVGALLMAVLGAGAGVLTGFKGLALQGTVYETAQFHAVLFAAVLGAFGALAYWGPKLWGRRLPEGPSGVLALLGLLAVSLVVIPDLIAGFLDQPAGEVNFDKYSSAVALNALTFAGLALLLVVVLAFGLVALRAFSRTGAIAGNDPWDGQTLEWATSSPPPLHNFTDDLVEVTSATPLLDRKEA